MISRKKIKIECSSFHQNPIICKYHIPLNAEIDLRKNDIVLPPRIRTYIFRSNEFQGNIYMFAIEIYTINVDVNHIEVDVLVKIIIEQLAALYYITEM